MSTERACYPLDNKLSRGGAYADHTPTCPDSRSLHLHGLESLRDDPRLRPETIQRIKELAAQYHYHPNRLTQGLFRGKAMTIGCIVPEVTSIFHARVLRGVMEGTLQASFHVITIETHNSY